MLEKLQELLNVPNEDEIVEFKEAKSNYDFTKLGRYFSALSNEANLKNKPHAWLIFGVEDQHHSIVGSQYRPGRKALQELKAEIANKTTNRISFIDIHELDHPQGRILLFQIPAAPAGIPIAFEGHYYARDGESLCALNLEKLERIRRQVSAEDWSAAIVAEASIDDLDPSAIKKARENYLSKFPASATEFATWNNITFLNKAKITTRGKITHAAILLLGRPESEHLLSPGVAKIRWVLKDAYGNDKDYAISTCPFLIAVDEIYAKIRNIKYRYLQEGSLFPNEVDQYEPFVIREAINNCIAHLKKGNQELENWLATQLDPRIDFNIFDFDHEGKHFAIFKIDATRNQPVRFRGIAYIRIGSYKKQLADHPERERKIWNQTSQIAFEKKIAVEKASSEDVLRLIDYPAFFEMSKLPLPDNRKGIIDRLIQDKLIESAGSNFSVTNLGGILFAKDLEQFENLARKAVRVIIYQGNNRIKTIKEQSGRRGYAVGFEGLLKYIIDQLPTNEVIEQALREQVSIFPPLAIRELVANAIIHQDFSVRGASPMVEIFANRIEITNPGKPLIDPLRFVDHSPESRNEQLARFMRYLNICEERGSGFDKVVFQCELYQLPAPEIHVGDNFTRVTLYAHQTLRQMDKQAKIRACYLHACLKYVSGELMTNQSLRERFGIDEKNYPTASRIIGDTIKAKLVRDYDPDSKSRKYAKYVPFWV